MFFDYMPDIYQSVQADIFIARDVPVQCRQYLKWLQRNGYLVKYPDVFLEDVRKSFPQYKIADRYIPVIKEFINN